jgi:hypothetical protein
MSTVLKLVLSAVAAALVGGAASAQHRHPSPFAAPVKEPAAELDPRQSRAWLDVLASLDRSSEPAALKLVGPAVSPARIMDAKLRPEWRKVVLGWKKSFPNLAEDFEVLGPGTPGATECATRAGLDGRRQHGAVIPGTYNCIAHSAGIKNVWINPYQTTAGWDLFYTPLGYRAADGLDVSSESGVRKVAVYATKTAAGAVKEYTHAAIQEPDGTWTSKLGSGPLIRHRTAGAVNGPSYGEVVRVYVKK